MKFSSVTPDIIPPDILLGAYAQGAFPMGDDGEIIWVSPEFRGIIPLDERFHIPHGLKKKLRKSPFEIRINSAFREVMLGCADREETWITEAILESYCALHDRGHAHSVECWDDDGLQGGLYGVSLGKAFFGESMFSRKTDASKVALVFLVDHLRSMDFRLLDTQWITDHLKTFGGLEIKREQYLDLLAEAIGA
ncbi:leucyl/phenylalanyl-tRNA--protein transferase [Luteolibacter algae]|uniref:Leucyl/phenylalanyl-tRNA--protein transferase n=1 Tax=Luteolibacter algae TaxID=454151 RepID=A0ABW5D528_9BACT